MRSARGAAPGRRHGTGSRRCHRLLASLGCLLFAGGLLATPASATRGLVTGFDDGLFSSPNAATRQAWLGRASEAGGGIARLTVRWSAIAPSRPANASDPSDPAYHFSTLDAVLQDVAARGLTPLVMVVGAPAWAEGPSRPANAPAGSWRPDPSALGQFAAAIARRYGGAYPNVLMPLPRVTLLQAWNEPNLNNYLTPQWQGKKPTGALLYRGLLNAFYAGVKSVRPTDTVISAGTAPFGDPPGGPRIRPVAFWRAVLCLKQRKATLRRAKCPKRGRATMDVLAHHPINTFSAPNRRAPNRDDASSADLFRITRVLRAAERFRTVLPRGHRPIWATETWWETNPLDAQFGVPPVRQAYRLEQALYLIWKAGGSAALNFQVGDSAAHAPGQVDQSGVFLADGTPKPSLTAFRFPLVGDRLGRKTVRAWGKSPAAGTLLVQRARGRTWSTLRSLSIQRGQVFSIRLRLAKRSVLRATVAGQTSLPWTQR
jgi:hypothetical protein